MLRILYRLIRRQSGQDMVEYALVLGFVTLGAASFLIYRLVGAKLSAAPPAAAQGQVVVAARELQVGTLLKEVDVRLGPWNGPVPKGAVTSLQDALNRGV